MTSHSVRILLADDVPANVRALTRLLLRRDCDVTAASDGQLAVERFQENTFDVVLLDLQMPGLNGLEACRAIRKLPGGRDVAIIAMSARGTQSDRQACHDAGMTLCLPKPIDVDELFETIDAIRHGDTPETKQRRGHEHPSDHGFILDHDTAMRRLQGDVGIYDLLIKQFRDRGTSLVTKIEIATAEGRCDEICDAAHQLRGIAANLEARQLQNLCATIEKKSARGMDSEMPAHVQELRRAVERLADALNQIQRSGANSATLNR